MRWLGLIWLACCSAASPVKEPADCRLAANEVAQSTLPPMPRTDLWQQTCSAANPVSTKHKPTAVKSNRHVNMTAILLVAEYESGI